MVVTNQPRGQAVEVFALAVGMRACSKQARISKSMGQLQFPGEREMVFRHYLWLPAAEIRCSAYLYDPVLDMRGSAGAGSTHAWAEVYVPGTGWITFDPTNRSVGGFNLIPVAVARHISQTMPVSGSFAGDVGAFLGLEVTVTVTAAEGERPVMAR